jgi:hypothetical protein
MPKQLTEEPKQRATQVNVKPVPAEARLRSCWPLVVSFVPVIFLIWMVCRLAVEVPFFDQWEFVPQLERMFRGTLTFSDIWAQHNEHRIFFPKLIMLGMAKATRWTIKYELAVNILMAMGVFCLIATQLWKAAKILDWPVLRWLIPISSVVVFSFSQYENWLWGWQIQMWLNLLTVLGGILLLTQPALNSLSIISAALLGIVATYSFGDGLLFWPIGFCLLLWRHAQRFPTMRSSRRDSGPRTRSYLAQAGWAVTSLLAIFFYYWHYTKPLEHPPLDSALKAPLTFIAYVLTYLGNMFGQISLGEGFPSDSFAMICGFLGVFLFGLCLWLLLKHKAVGIDLLLPWLAMSTYSVATAVVTGLARVGFGQQQALAPRYATMTIPFWISLLVLLLLVSRSHAKQPGGSDLSGARQFARYAFGLTVAFLVLSSVLSVKHAMAFSRRLTIGREHLADIVKDPSAPPDLPAISLLYKSDIILARYPVLVEHHLSFCQQQKSDSK